MGGSPSQPLCPVKPVTVQENFDLESYISEPWWVQEQMAISYLPEDQNYCVRAQYNFDGKEPNHWAQKLGWDVQVENFSQEVDGTEVNSGTTLCAKQKDGAKLLVAPCFLPPIKLFAGPYWVLEYNADAGWALISGGEPTNEGEGGLCRTGTGVNGSGLWIFTRAQQRDETLIENLKANLRERGFDTEVLNMVDNSKCGTEDDLF